MSKKGSDKKQTNMLAAAFMLFILPILSVVIGIFLGWYVGKSAGLPIKTLQIVGGVVGFIIAVVLIKLFDKSAVVDENQEKITWDDM